MKYTDVLQALYPEPKSFNEALASGDVETSYDPATVLAELVGENGNHFPDEVELAEIMTKKLGIDKDWALRKSEQIIRASDEERFDDAWRYVDQACRKAKVGTLPSPRMLYKMNSE